jgi:hypothetical protein
MAGNSLGQSEKAPKLMEQMRRVLRVQHYAFATEKAYCEWVRRFVKFHGMKSRADLTEGPRKVEEFLTHLAVVGQHPRSKVQGRRSKVEGPRSKVQGRGANIQHPTSNIQHPTSNIQHPTSNIQGRGSRVEGRRAKGQRPTSNIQGRGSRVEWGVSGSKVSSSGARKIIFPGARNAGGGKDGANLVEVSLGLPKESRFLRQGGSFPDAESVFFVGGRWFRRQGPNNPWRG